MLLYQLLSVYSNKKGVFFLTGKCILMLLLVFVLSFCSVVPAYASDIGTFLDGAVEADGTIGSVMDDESGDSLNPSGLFAKYQNIAAFITGMLTITSLFALFYNISKLSTTLSNEFSRKRTIVGIATSAAGVALMGSATLLIAFFYQLF